MRPARFLLAAALALVPLALPACGKDPMDPATWSSHTGKIPFVVGWEKGLAAAKAGGKPLAIFLTADW